MRNKKYFDTIVKCSLLLILKYLKDGNVVVILKDFSTPAHLIKYLCTLCRTKSSHSSIYEMNYILRYHHQNHFIHSSVSKIAIFRCSEGRTYVWYFNMNGVVCCSIYLWIFVLSSLGFSKFLDTLNFKIGSEMKSEILNIHTHSHTDK